MILTYYSTLYDPTPTHIEDLSWADLVASLTHRPFASKDKAPGFGAHQLASTTCVKHKVNNKPTVITVPHRCAQSVSSVSLFVFDVDIGTAEDIAVTAKSLQEAGLAAFFYSSYSYTPDHPTPPFRLLIPSTRPVLPHEYAHLRSHLIAQHKIPCAPEKCSSTSHFWFLPSCPPERLEYAITDSLEGKPFDVDSVAPPAPSLRPGAFGAGTAGTTETLSFEPPEEPDPSIPVDTQDLRDRVTKYATKLARKGDAQKAEYLKNLLVGEQLAEHGSRNHAAFVTAGCLVWCLPSDTPLSHLMLLFRPSLNSMVSAGSKLSEDKVERMLLTAMEGRARADAETDQLKESFKATRDRVLRDAHAAKGNNETR